MLANVIYVHCPGYERIPRNFDQAHKRLIGLPAIGQDDFSKSGGIFFVRIYVE